MGGGLGESLGVDELEYEVPVDPMEALHCESCQ